MEVVVSATALFKTSIQGPLFGGSELPFVVGEHFLPRHDPFPIYEIGKNFQEWFCPITLPPETGGYSPCVYKFAKNLGEENILSGLDEPDLEVSPRCIWDILCKQHSDQFQFLGQDGYPNLFFCRSFDGTMALASARFMYKRGWSFRAYNRRVRDCRQWFENGRIIVPLYPRGTSSSSLKIAV